MFLRRLFVSLGIVALAAGAVVAAEEAVVELPVSFGKVWYRPAIKDGFGSGKQSGFLTVTEDGLEFSSKKHSDFLPWSKIEMVSYGTMQGDPDTKWVVLGLQPVAGERHTAGLRDGSRMGYGTETVAIFDAVMEGVRRAGAGPYDVPDGRSPYITRYLQFSLALPDGWQALEVSNTLSDGRPVWGRTIFSARDLKEIRRDEAALKQVLAAIGGGAEPAVQLDRYEAAGGFTCDEMKKAGRRALHTEIDVALKPWRLTAEPRWTPVAHRACTAWTAEASAQKNGAEVALKIFAVSDDETVYLFTSRGGGGEFETFTRSLLTAVAR